MLKDYLAERHVSMYSLAVRSGVPYSTVNDLANGRIEVENCRAGVLKKIADALSITMDDLYDQCHTEMSFFLEKQKVLIQVRVKNKTYFAEFYDGDEPVALEICAVNLDTAAFIRSLAKWTAEEYFEQCEWETTDVLLAHAKR